MKIGTIFLDGRICTKCGDRKLWSEFYTGSSVNNKQPCCIPCFKERSRSYRDKSRDKSKKYREDNRGKMLQYGKQYYKENKEKRSAKRKLYYKENADRLRLNQRIYNKSMRGDPSFILKKRMDRQMRRMGKIMRQSINLDHKSRIVEGLLGYSICDLKIHLEKMFTDGMSWERFKEIHIDHIVPLSLFNLDDEDDFRQCWSLSNLQPLWAHDNLSKGAAITSLI